MATAAAVEGQPSQVVTVADGMTLLPMRSRVGLIVGVAAAVAIAVAGVLWMRAPDYRVLFSNLSDRDGGAIVAALGQMNVPYKFAEGGGAILVPAAQVHDARLRLASQGLPKGGNVGFELLEAQKFGMTQFQEQVQYQRALEGELARSIQALGQVSSARVHLAMPKQTVFLRDQQKPTASVLLALYPGKSLDRSQIAGIVHLVAASVPELAPKNVSVVDQTGALLSSNADGGDPLRLDPSQLAYVQQVEAQLLKRIGDLLEPIVGRTNFRAQVNADVDFTVTESTDERFKPNGNPAEAAVRSVQSNESASTNPSGGPQGVPGALSNQPPVPTTAQINQKPPAPQPNQPAQAAGDAAVRNPSATQKSSVTNYEVDKTIRHTRAPTGALKRLSAAVVINYRKAAEGEEKPAPIPEKEMQEITALVKEAMGFREDRGDTLKVSAAPFSVEVIEEPPEVPLWKRPETIAMGMEAGRALLIGIVVLGLVLGVLRPILKSLAAPQVRLQTAAAGGGAAALPSPDGAGAAPPALPRAEAIDDEEGLLPEQKQDKKAIAAILRGPDKVLNAKAIAKQDPKLVANVVRNWVKGGSGDE